MLIADNFFEANYNEITIPGTKGLRLKDIC
jgi:hypothetical protein